jgi:hypothetical protein
MTQERMEEHEVYETPALTEYGTIEETTQQTIDISIVIG